ncbi:MAG: hypothetical protein ACPGU7_02685 [Gammaproteobacteria bacterium]
MVQIIVALAGLQDPPWAESFFPDDIPAQWRLDYYANEFEALVVRPGERVMDGLDSMVEDLEDLEDLEDVLTLWVPREPSGAPDVSVSWIVPYDVDSVWTGPDSAPGGAVAVLNADEPWSRRDLRGAIELWMQGRGRSASEEAGDVVLAFAGEAAVQTARDARVLAGLLGY